MSKGGAATRSSAAGPEWAVVTGGSKGIGKAIGQRLLEGGANVVLVARNADDLAAAAAEAEPLIGSEQQVLTAQADVADRASITGLFDELHDRIPRLDHFVANAGTGQVTPFLELTDDEVDRVVGLNLTGTLKCVQLAGRMITEREVINSCIIVVSSIRGLGRGSGPPDLCRYQGRRQPGGAGAARELAPHGVRVNTLSPGITETPLTAPNPEAFAQAAATCRSAGPANPPTSPRRAYFLCSPAGQFVTGLNMIVDGGESLR